MKKIAFIVVTLLSSFVSSFAQTERKTEFFAGYSFESVDTGVTSSDLSTTTTLDSRFKTNGFNLSATGYFTKRFGVAADFSAHFQNRTDLFGATTGASKISLYNRYDRQHCDFLRR